MKKKQDVAVLSEYAGLRTVGVKFGGNLEPYSYFVPEGDEPAVGDIVVTSFYDPDADNVGDGTIVKRGEGMLAQARLVEVHNFPSQKATKFYLKLLTMVELRASRQRCQDLQTKIDERRDIMSKLDDLLLQQSKLDHYRRLAEANPVARELLERLTLK